MHLCVNFFAKAITTMSQTLLKDIPEAPLSNTMSHMVSQRRGKMDNLHT